jgi:dTDP-4-dehydrorhamnose 3,5-epimerase
MKIIQTDFKDLLIIEPKVLEDSRGYFLESYNRKTFADRGISIDFVQDNQSSSTKGVLRGLHYQLAPYSQTKLVRVLFGEILDVVVDLRKGEPTFGRHFSIKLSAINKKQLLVPKGFAHGFVVLSNRAEVFYKCDQFYNPEADRGIRYNDPELAIDWILKDDEYILSDKDRNHPLLSESVLNF